MNSVALLMLTVLSCAMAGGSAADAPEAQAGPTNLTRVLEKAGQYTVLIKLLKATNVGDQLNNQLNNSNTGLTIFAPTDNAFANLKTGTLNQLTNEQQVQLVQYHVVPTLLSMSQFQTVSNPVRTNAGDSGPHDFPMNVTTSGNMVNISTGLVNTTVANTVYSDDHLAVYQVDSVLLPVGVFVEKPPSPAPAPVPVPAPAPAPEKSAKKKASTKDDSDDEESVDTSSAVSLIQNGVMCLLGVMVFSL